MTMDPNAEELSRGGKLLESWLKLEIGLAGQTPCLLYNI